MSYTSDIDTWATTPGSLATSSPARVRWSPGVSGHCCVTRRCQCTSRSSGSLEVVAVRKAVLDDSLSIVDHDDCVMDITDMQQERVVQARPAQHGCSVCKERCV